MLVIEGLRAIAADVARMPRPVHVGMALAVAAFALDVLVHLSPAPHDHGAGFRPEEHLAHLAGIAAMVLILAGVVIDGVRHNQTRRRTSNAHR
jgi:hypothetical protein